MLLDKLTILIILPNSNLRKYEVAHGKYCFLPPLNKFEEIVGE